MGGFQATEIGSARKKFGVERNMHFRNQKGVSVVTVQAAQGNVAGYRAESSLGSQ